MDRAENTSMRVLPAGQKWRVSRGQRYPERRLIAGPVPPILGRDLCFKIPDLLNPGGISGRPLQGTARPSKILLKFMRQQRAPTHRIQLGFYDPKKAIHHKNSCGVGSHNHACSANPMPEAHKGYTGHFYGLDDH
jgi:hypothetical protein